MAVNELSFKVPPGAAASVKVIDTTSQINNIRWGDMVVPKMPGFKKMYGFPSVAFLVESPNGGKAVFDLGIRKDSEKMTPMIQGVLQKRGWTVAVEKNTSDILLENQVDLKDINAIIWSHWHWDHIGDPSTFPPSTEVVVGPGFKENILPGYPANEKSYVSESDFEGRNLREITFTEPQSLDIGNFKAFDFFGDGSFYLLDAPGHAVGHLCGLARTTSGPDTFIFMGADLCHHVGEIRPSQYLPLPKEISPNPFTGALHPACPCAPFEELQESRGRNSTTSFFDPQSAYDMALAMQSLRKAEEADAHDNVLFLCSHDHTMLGIVDMFPLAANDWKKKGWREKMFWAFLADFEEDYKASSQSMST